MPQPASTGAGGVGPRRAQPRFDGFQGVVRAAIVAEQRAGKSAGNAMLHLKVSAGRNSLEDLARWQNACLKDKRKKQQPLLLRHVTRLIPKRKHEILEGGSIYWIIKGRIVARQKIVDLKPVEKAGRSHFAITYEPKLILVAPRRTQQIEGWRYLAAKDAPPDIAADKAAKDFPEDLKVELLELGLL
jgi:hypothetical protein